MDTMNEALHKNIEKNIFPHWRNHQSLKGKFYFIHQFKNLFCKGWCSMNYPSIMTNPMLRRPPAQP
jgi:hypothetical protein